MGSSASSSAADRLPARSLWRSEAGNVSALPGSLDRPQVVVPADERHGFVSGHAVEHRYAGECGTGPSAAATTCNLHALCGCTAPGFVQCFLRVIAVGGQSKVRPADPPRVPWHGLRLLVE